MLSIGPCWDNELEWSYCSATFKRDAIIELKPKSGSKTKCTIVDCRLNKYFVTEAHLPFRIKICFKHQVNETDLGIKLIHFITINGPLTFLLKRVVGRKFEIYLPDTMENLISIAKINIM